MRTKIDYSTIRTVRVHKDQFDAIEQKANSVIIECKEDGRVIVFDRHKPVQTDNEYLFPNEGISLPVSEKEIEVAIEHLKAGNISAKHIEMAIQALEETKYYRAIGSQKDVQLLISKGRAYEQVARERDVAIEQLSEIGVCLGQKMDHIKALKEQSVTNKLNISVERQKRKNAE